MKLQFKDRDRKVIFEREFKLGVDCAAFTPYKGAKVRLPKERKVRYVLDTEYIYGKGGGLLRTVVKVTG